MGSLQLRLPANELHSIFSETWVRIVQVRCALHRIPCHKYSTKLQNSTAFSSSCVKAVITHGQPRWRPRCSCSTKICVTHFVVAMQPTFSQKLSVHNMI